MNNPIAGFAGTPEQQEAFRRAQLGIAPPSASPLSGFTPGAIWEGFSPPGYLVKGIIGPSELTVLFGMSGHFKSVVAIDLAMCVGSGQPFHGVRCRQGAVLYVAGEGHLGIKKRLRAWMMAHGMDSTSPQPKVFFTKSGADLMGNCAQLIATVRSAGETIGEAIRLVVLDTLASNFGQGDENHASDMTYAINNARAAAPDAAIMVVHHSGHGTGERERGSSALAATGDYRVLAAYDETTKLVELRFMKVKDDERPEAMVFEWRKVNLEWTDEDGEELSSVVLERLTDQVGIPGGDLAGMGKHADTILRTVQAINRQQRKNLEDKGRDPNESRVLLSRVRHSMVDGPQKMDRRRFHQALKSLIERRLLVVDEPFVSLIEDVE